jgi:hypothetical protein
MIWKAKYTHVDYVNGTTRLKRCFAWLPKYIDGNIIWLETYDILQGYISNKYTVTVDDKNVDFIKFQWINLANRCK